MGEDKGISGRNKEPTNLAALTKDHSVNGFDCGYPELNSWLETRAINADETNTAKTYVVCRSEKVIAYFALSAGCILHVDAPSRLRRNSPDPIPVIILCRLAVEKSEQRNGIGSLLLKEAMVKTVQAAEIIGARALLVHALTEKAAVFYEQHGFARLKEQAKTLYIHTKTIRDGIE